MTELLKALASPWNFLWVVLVFGLAPGFCLRLIVVAYPRNDPRRQELIAELYAVPRVQRPLWVAEQLEVALFEGLVHRVSAAIRSFTARRRAQNQTDDRDAELAVKVDHVYRAEELPGWMQREVHDHDRRYECDGHVFVDGRRGGLICKKCGR